MKKKTLAIISLIIISCSQDIKLETCSVLDTNNGITYFEDEKFNGTCNLLYNNEVLWRTRTYKNGDLRNEISYYLDTGGIEYNGNRKNGEIHGEFISYYKNGQISIEGELNKGLYVGEWKYYLENGEMDKILNYNKQGKIIDSIKY
mgnify:CR=1 FL=1|tara:strand:+ start:138 stop:575 length:438 start_codon:yes stop_codon:yes gene_type:complete